jgi:hypothetical protein
MQVVCGNCQLSFQAPEGASGLMCPICRSPLRAAQASPDAAVNQNIIEWDGGSLDDLIAFLSGPALAARVEVLSAKGGTPVGEVHLLAGGVSEALLGGKSTDDALDRLRAVPGARFRIEPRLPNPSDGDLGNPGPESGTLDSRPLAHLMRYCEQYVITCGIEVWRGSETARVEYRKGEISGVTVGGIDAPERLAEVMQWASGNYRLMVPRLTMPESVPKQPIRPTPAPLPAAQVGPSGATAAPARPPATPAAARPPATPPAARPAAVIPPSNPVLAPTPRAPLSGHATRTIFGMPALDLAGLKAADAAAVIAKQAAAATATAPAMPGPTPSIMPAASMPAASAHVAAPAAVGSSSPSPLAAAPAAPAASAYDRPSATKTIFGVPAPKIPEKSGDKGQDKAQQEKAQQEKAQQEKAQEEAKAAAAAEAGPQRRKTGARKTVVPAPAIVPPGATAGATASESAPVAVATAPAAVAEISRTTHQGYGQSAPAEIVSTKAPAVEDRTLPVRVATPKKSRGIPVWTYVGVGFLFGLALLGIYQLVGVLAH